MSFFCKKSPGNGVIDFPEFVQLMESKKNPDEVKEDLIEAFRVFDCDNKGYIQSSELRQSLLSMSDKISKEELDDIMRFTNLTEDRKVSFKGNLPLQHDLFYTTQF